MSVTPGDLLTEAQALSADINHSEARRRTVVGRAYYAAYHALLAAATRAGYRYARDDGRPPGSHENLMEWAMNRSGSLDLGKSAFALRDLKRQRAKADYRLTETVTFNDAQASLTKAVHLIAALPAA
jgi:uncharacterized protein (UPF0332 family)